LAFETVDGVTQDHDQPGIGHRLGDPAMGVQVVEVEGRTLAKERTLGGAVEQPLILLGPPHPLPVAVGVPRPTLPGRGAVAEEVRLLDRRQVDLWMAGQRGV
jgi:hypothetical protein